MLVNPEDKFSHEVHIRPYSMLFSHFVTGQVLPAGLHMRMNLKTGKNEAKLMDGDSGMKYWKTEDKEGNLPTSIYKSGAKKNTQKSTKTPKLQYLLCD